MMESLTCQGLRLAEHLQSCMGVWGFVSPFAPGFCYIFK